MDVYTFFLVFLVVVAVLLTLVVLNFPRSKEAGKP